MSYCYSSCIAGKYKYLCFVATVIILFLGYSFFSLMDKQIMKMVKQDQDVAPAESIGKIPGEDFDFDFDLISYQKCKIYTKEALSAVSRAETVECKKQLADVACGSVKGTLFPPSLPSYCPLNTRLKHSADLVTDMVTDNNNPPVKIVFVLTLNGRQVRQVRRLIKAIYNTYHYYYIHVDVRQDYLYRELLPLQDSFPNIRLSPIRFATIWGGKNLLDTHLHLMSELLAMTDWPWDYYVNLSESDYPIKRAESLTAFLTKFKGYNFLKSYAKDTADFIRKQELDKTFFECDHHLWQVGPQTLPQGIRMDGGSDWIGIDRDFANYAVGDSNQLLDGLKQMYKYALLPSESFFHVLLQNSKFCDSWVDNDLHLTNWPRRQGCKCQYKHIDNWCSCSPNDFNTADMDKIMNYTQEPTFFGQKFEAIVNQDIINKLDAFMFGSNYIAIPGIKSYWENLYHHLDVQKAPDHFMTVYQSFIRMSLRHLGQIKESCKTKFVNLLEVTVQYLSDNFHGALILHQVELLPSGEKLTLETRLDKSDYYQVYNPHGPMERLLHMEVGTDFDPKEEIFRNYLYIMGPNSEVTLRHAWTKGTDFTVSIGWIDPANVVAASYDVAIQKTSHVAMHKPNFKKPLRPGVWTVKMMYELKVVAETVFLVVPLTVLNGKPITPAEVDLLHNGPVGLYDSKDFTELIEVLNVNKSSDAKGIAKFNAKKVGKPLQSLVDRLVERFWGIQDICSVKNVPTQCPKLHLCQSTPWSSRSPDPKTNVKH